MTAASLAHFVSNLLIIGIWGWIAYRIWKASK